MPGVHYSDTHDVTGGAATVRTPWSPRPIDVAAYPDAEQHPLSNVDSASTVQLCKHGADLNLCSFDESNGSGLNLVGVLVFAAMYSGSANSLCFLHHVNSSEGLIRLCFYGNYKHQHAGFRTRRV